MTEAYQQEHATIYGRNVWHYLVCSDIGNIHAVQYEAQSFELTTKLYMDDNHKAEKEFRRLCNGILSGKL